MRVQRVDVFKRARQRFQHRDRVAHVDRAELLVLERVDEALGQTVALRAAYRPVDGLRHQLAGELHRVAGDIGAAVVADELPAMSSGQTLRAPGLRAGAVWLDQRHQLRPGHREVHLVEELAHARLLRRQFQA